jgi:hypothetical protein
LIEKSLKMNQKLIELIEKRQQENLSENDKEQLL